MSEIYAYQKIVFPNEKMKSIFLEKEPSDLKVSNGSIENLDNHLNNDSCSQYIKYIGGEYDEIRSFWNELIHKYGATIFSIYMEDHTGECIFNVESKDLSVTFEEHEDFEFPDDKDYLFNLIEALDYLVGQNLQVGDANQTPTVSSIKYPEGSLVPKKKFIECNKTYPSTEEVYIYLSGSQCVPIELLCDKLRLKGWKFITVFDSKRLGRGFIYSPVIVASKDSNSEMEEFLNMKETSGYPCITDIQHNGITFFSIFENFSVIEYLTNEFGAENAKEYFDGLSTEVQKALSMSNCQIVIRTDTSDVSLSLGIDLYDAIGSLTSAIECDWDASDYCII